MFIAWVKILCVSALLLCSASAQTACQDGEIRLSDGETDLEGRVEICFDGDWGTICDDLWDSNDAKVVCRQLELSTNGAIATTRAYYGQGTGPIHLDNVECTGEERALSDCAHQGISNHNCGHAEDAGVYCQPEDFSCTDGDIRLVGGEVENEGRVEICFNNQYGTMCDDSWDNNEAQVVCGQLGFSREQAIGIGRAFYGEGIGIIYFDDVDCTGSEQNISQCDHRGLGSHNCGHLEDAGVLCKPNGEPSCKDGEVRLSQGRIDSEGRVEVCFNGRWGTVCDDLWGTEEAVVVCRQLNYSTDGAIALGLGDFGQGEGPIFLDNLECNTSESALHRCPNNGISQHNCGHSEDAAVVCPDPTFTCTNGTVRLVGGDLDSSGRVEVCINNHWGTICDDSWDHTDARVVCNQLEFTKGHAVALPRGYFGIGVGIIWFDDMECTGNETSIVDCPHRGFGVSNCRHAEDANVLCPVEDEDSECENGGVRLMNGTAENEGRVEVCINGHWGTVCDDAWDNNDAAVVCRQLGFTAEGALAVSKAFFMEGSGPIFLDNVGCTGNETELLDCTSVQDIAIHNCHHGEDAGVICPVRDPQCYNGELRLAGGSSREGRVEICINNRWGTICDDSWDNNEGNVVCSQLGFNLSETRAIAVTGAALGAGSGPIFLDGLRCLGSEASLLHCPGSTIGIQDCQHTEDAGVYCTSIPCEDGSIRLVGGMHSGSGRVEVCVDGLWGTVCEENFDENDADYVCGALGFEKGARIVSGGFFGLGQGNVRSFTSRCNSDLVCIHEAKDLPDGQCGHDKDVGVFCPVPGEKCMTGDVRLMGGMEEGEGRVEVCLANTWGTVCDDSWDDGGAQVVCKQLGYNEKDAEAQYLAFYGEGTDPIIMDDVKCGGTEESLLQCRGVFTHNCVHMEDAGVSCLATKSAPDPGQQQGEEDSDGVSGSTLAAILIPIIIVAILVTAAVIVVVGVVVYFRNRNKSSRLDETPIVPAGDSEVVAENEFADAKLDLESSDL